MKHRLAALLCAVIIILVTAMPAVAQLLGPGPEEAGDRLSVATEGATSVGESSARLNGFLESLGPYATVSVWFELSNGQSTAHQTMSAPGVFSAPVGGLAMGTAYQFRARASSNAMGGQQSEGAFVSFTTRESVPQAPIVISTSSASDVTSGSAMLRGYVSSMGPYQSINVWFQWGPGMSYGNESQQQVIYGPGPFSIPLSGLAPNTTYYFRAAARPALVGVSIVYGSTLNFTSTGAAALSVSTGSEMGVTSSSATIMGYLESLGSYRSANVWFEWGPTAAYGQITNMQPMYSPETFNYTLQGLNPGTTYHFRALAAPSLAGGATVHGFDSVFTTTSAPSSRVSTLAASNITGQTATLNGILASVGSGSFANVWFEYGTDTTFGSSTPQQTLNYQGNFIYQVKGLLPGMTYYYRAAAFSNGYNVYGQYSTFQTTSSSPASVSTNPAGSISTTAATLNAFVNSLGNTGYISVYFNYGSTPNYGNTTPPTKVTFPGTVSYQLSGLTPGTDYYFQAVARAPDNSVAYGGNKLFSTIANSSLSITTMTVSSVTTSSAILNGYLQDIGNTTTVQTWFEYGTTANMGNTTEMQSFNRPGPFSSVITGLAPGRTYYYTAAALNPTGGGRSVTGTISSFVTPGSGPGPSPTPETPPFVWLIIAGFVIVIIIIIILLTSRR